MARDDRSMLLAAFAALTAVGAFLLAAVGVFVAATNDGDGGDGGGGGAEPASVSLTEFDIAPDPIQAAPGKVELAVTNNGSQIHNLQLEDGPVTSDLESGASTTLDLGELDAGSYTVFCNIPGHRDQGMEAALVVSDDAAPPSDSSADPQAEHDYAQMDKDMPESIMRWAAVDSESDTGAVGNQRLEPVEVRADGTKVFELTAAITDWEVEPGKVVKAWTYNGMVPGPWIDLDLNDKVEVTLINNLPMGSEIHWHGLDTPFEQDGVVPLTQPLVAAGETYTYKFTATHPAVAMYHPHHHGNLQIVNGMIGAITVGDLGEELPIPEGQTIGGVALPPDIPVSQEIPMILNDSGVIGLSLNGKSFPSTDGFTAEVGDWVAIHYFNEGNQIHPMHQHQFNQLVVAKDGNVLDSPYWVDTLNVAPGERYTVLMQLTDPGIWVWHCHILTHVERENGVFGMLTAWIVGTPGEDFEVGGTGSAS